jgi:small subunit ribosomal protein S17e
VGRIKAKFLKSITEELMEKHADRFDTEFEKNKAVVTENIDGSSKKLRNIIAGYATRLKKSGRY